MEKYYRCQISDRNAEHGEKKVDEIVQLPSK
jgi:hypothetical protein